MIEMSRFISVDKTSAMPVYLQVAEKIIFLIEQGVLPGCIKIQPTRHLAQKINVNRNTVLSAYNELQDQGWIEAKPRKGYFISAVPPHVKPSCLPTTYETSQGYPVAPFFETNHTLVETLTNKYPSAKFKYVFNEGFPDVRLAPLKELMREYNSIGNSKTARRYLSYSAKQGSLRLRQELAKMLRQTRGLSIGENNILVTKGAQMAIYLAASLLLKPGDNVIVGEPNYFLVNEMFKRLGANVYGVPVDTAGIDVDAAASLCQEKNIRMMYVIPHHHHPTTVTLSAARRVTLLQLAAKHKFIVIEDDFDFDIHFQNRPVLPMASADKNGSVIYIGTFTKTLAPAIRLGFIVAPENLIGLLAQHRFMIDMQGDNLLEEAMAHLLKNGIIEKHLKKIRILYKERRDLLCNMLNDKLPGIACFNIPEGGLCVWVTFKGVDAALVAAEAGRNGLFIRDGKKYNTPQTNYNALCIGFASMNLQELGQAATILCDAVKTIKEK